MILLVGFSRVVTANHYPTDVLVGWALGFVVVGIFDLIERFVRKEWVRSLILLALALPGLFFVRTEDYFTSLGLLIGMVTVFPYEKKYINFQDTKNVWAMILRVAGAFAVYAVMNTVLKLPFDKEWLNSGTLGANLIRSARYAIMLFVLLGVYPRVFPAYEKIGRKNNS